MKVEAAVAEQEPKAKGRTTQDAILDAAIDLFIEKGFETTPMDAIAEKAGVAKGTLYYHFRSKEGIVESIIERFVGAAEAAFEPIVAAPDGDPLRKLRALVEKETELDARSFSRLHRMKNIDIVTRTQEARVARFSPFYARIIEEGNAAGTWKTEYPLEYSQITIAASAFIFDPQFSASLGGRIQEAVIDLMARGLGMKPEKLAWAYEPLKR
jgi:AcrR family transcriptional regulator